MTYALAEPFDDKWGRWTAFAPFDGTEASNSVKGFLTTQQHADIRSFRVLSGSTVPVPQTDLDAQAQTVLDAEPQTSLELKPGAILSAEPWTLTLATGTNNDLILGKSPSHGGWSRAKVTTNNAAGLSMTMESVITTGIDISFADYVSLIFPNYNTFDSASSYIRFCSGGAFGAGHDSAQVAFSGNTSVMPQMLLAYASFAAAGFDPTNVTGVRIHLAKAVAPPNNSTINIMGLRAVKSTWAQSALDFDTRIGVICPPVTVDGNIYGGTLTKNFEFVRGDGTRDDPIPADVAMNAYFYPGGATAPNDATAGTFNKLSLIFREIKDLGAGTGSHMEMSLLFNDSQTSLEVKRVDSTGGSPPVSSTNHGTYTTVIGGPLDSSKYYLFRAEIRGTQVFATIYETLIDGSIVTLVWSLPITVTNVEYIYRNGRVGFIAGLVSRDSYVSQIEVSPTGFATVISQVMNQRSPVDGAQLSAVFASDENLWSEVSGSDIFVDQTKTLSGNGSFRTSKSLTTNTVVMDDWTQSYLNVAIWVPNNVTLRNQPQIILNTPTTTENLIVPRLQPAQWNSLHFDLGIFRNLLTGVGYSFTIQEATDTDKPLGAFWVDSEIVIGRRRVAWAVRATPNGLFRDFKDLVNDPTGAVHFPSNERGTSLQVKATALTQDAWVSNFKVFPRYAQLGLPVYDQGYEKR